MIITASLLRTRGNMKLAMGNRDAMPPTSVLADRADRAAKNMLENLVLFGVFLFAASKAAHPDRAIAGAELFVAARIVYWPVYLLGIPGLRTLVYAASMFGLAAIAMSLF
jgi:uncharacterized MAPEG superfamily protein